MKKLMFLSLLAVATPLFAQRRVDFFLDVEGVHRGTSFKSFSPGVVRFEPAFNTGGGVGAGFNFFFSDRVSLEAKAAALEGKMRLRIVGQDSVENIDLGYAQIYPISAVLQWHLAEHGALRPYIGAGVVYTIMKNINKTVVGTTVNGIRFRDPTGLVADGGLELSLGHRWSLYGDARYSPVETKSRAEFIGGGASTEFDVRILVVSTGVSCHF